MRYFLHPNGTVELVPAPKIDVQEAVEGASRYRETHSDHNNEPYPVPGNQKRNSGKNEKTQ